MSLSKSSSKYAGPRCGPLNKPANHRSITQVPLSITPYSQPSEADEGQSKRIGDSEDDLDSRESRPYLVEVLMIKS